jgi:hypothetical protein
MIVIMVEDTMGKRLCIVKSSVNVKKSQPNGQTNSVCYLTTSNQSRPQKIIDLIADFARKGLPLADHVALRLDSHSTSINSNIQH